MEYNRQKTLEYAHRWAYGRNPRYYDFTRIGGDCTNFASQCVFAGAGVMNYTPTYGWFYISANYRTPSWTGVEYFYNFMTRDTGPGPYMKVVPLSGILPGDVIQLRFPGERIFAHTPVVVKTGARPAPENILMAAHTFDTDYRPLSTFVYAELRPLHVIGVRT
jgi:hypothetical protein